MLRRLGLVLLLAGCAGPQVAGTIVQPTAPVAVPTPQPMILRPVQWQVMGVAQLKALVAQMQASKQNTVVFVLDGGNYTNLSLNLVEIERYVREQKTVLQMLRSIVGDRVTTDKPKQKSR